MRPAHGTQTHIILQNGKRDKLPYIFLISPSRFQVRDVRQPFLFVRNICELLELRARRRSVRDLGGCNSVDLRSL